MNAFDIGASVVIIGCIGLAFRYRYLWLIYAVACLIIAIVDYNIKLYGQSIMNFTIFGLAIKNFWQTKQKGDDDEH